MDISPLDCPNVAPDFHIKLRTRFLTKLHSVISNEPDFQSSVSLFKGIETLHKNYDDIDYLVEQESTFWYLFGVKQADCLGVIHNKSGKTVLFVPQLSQAYKLWMIVKQKQQFKEGYHVDEVLFIGDLKKYLEEVNSTIYLYSGIDTDSDLKVDEPSENYIGNLKVNREILWPLISNLRVVKTPEQIQILKYVCKTSTNALIMAAKSAKPGLTQIQLHSVFHFQHSVKSGSIQLGFNSICSSGRDCATLHYVQNDKLIQPDQMILLDMGGRWYGYVADQAITFPVSGKFTDKQRKIYTAVRQAQKAVEAVVKPGVKWEDMHLIAEKVILEHLIAIGIVNQAPIEELVQNRVGAVFFCHGLGHLFGLKTHDVGGYTEGPKRSDKAGLSKLRTRRTLEEGICITVEPGVYFIDFMIEKALKDEVLSKYLNKEKIEEYKQVGGVRLQDDIVITKDGCELLSSLPREIEDVEAMLLKN